MKTIIQIAIVLTTSLLFSAYSFADVSEIKHSREEKKTSWTIITGGQEEQIDVRQYKKTMQPQQEYSASKIQSLLIEKQQQLKKQQLEIQKETQKQQQDNHNQEDQTMLPKKEKQEKSTERELGDHTSCDQKEGFDQKIKDIQSNASQKIVMLTKLDASLQEILPLIKKLKIQNTLQKNQKSVQAMKKKYIALSARLQTNPKSICEKGLVWKTYNEETKEVIVSIRKQFSLLKK